MDRNSVPWRGYWPASPTPFTADGALDEASLAKLMEHYVSVGVHGVLVNGTSGEWWSQTDDERRRVARTAIEAVGGRIPVVVGCTAFTAKAAIALARDAKAAGADGALFTPPPYVHPTQDEVYEHYRIIDSEVDLAMVAYNWPRGTAVEIEIETAAKIADLEHVVALKNSTADTDLVLDYIEHLGHKVRIFASLISRRGLAILRNLGGDGYIDGGGIGAPFGVPFFESLWADRIDVALDMAERWSSLTCGWILPDFGGKFAAPSAQLKEAMRMLGQPGGQVRQPLLPMRDEQKIAELRTHLEKSGILR